MIFSKNDEVGFVVFETKVRILVGAIIRALNGQEIESGYVRGAAIGAISGVIFLLRSSSLQCFYGNQMNLALDVYCIWSPTFFT
ncbi:NEP1-interacting protein-like 1 [Olea europaea var. sylvestris]|uniref:NEP1-interacting protein-like 1 n=1 Tax=Olea europaea var. sylvestris TaxID=158386 RepID=UPI000C1D1A90|nr:NEP1-interacting protein-like 1 [Olea europaea var. sylvestris]